MKPAVYGLGLGYYGIVGIDDPAVKSHFNVTFCGSGTFLDIYSSNGILDRIG